MFPKQDNRANYLDRTVGGERSGKKILRKDLRILSYLQNVSNINKSRDI